MYLPPGNSNPNQPNQTGYENRGQQELNEQQVSWANWISHIYHKHIDLFQWLLELFSVKNWSITKEKDLESAITNPQTLLKVFDQLLEAKKAIDLDKQKLKLEIERANHLRKFLVSLFEIKSLMWWDQDKELEKALSDPHKLFEAFSKLQQDTSSIEQSKQKTLNLNYTLNQQSQQIFNLQQEIENLRRENRSTTQLQSRIDYLERENQELHARVSSLLGKLSDRDRDKTSTITSNDSRPQRDVLTQKFIQLNNQDFTAASIEIFNHRCSVNPALKYDRKREIALVKSILSKHILKNGSDLFMSNKLIQPEDFPKTAEYFTDLLLKDLEMPTRTNCPKAILNTLVNLVEKGLNLVKDIVNDEPPGELLIEDEGTVFNSEIHQPVPGCDPIGRILYTTYPGYRVNNRIIGEALKAFVFTVPEEEFGSVKTVSNIENKQLANENDSANTSTDAENTQSVESNSVHDEATQSVESSSFQVQQPIEQQSLTNDGIHPQTFTGTVVVGGNAQLCLRNSRKLHDRSDQKVSNKEFLTFDAWAKGEMVEANEQKDDSWFRVANKNLWLPKVYIHVNES